MASTTWPDWTDFDSVVGLMKHRKEQQVLARPDLEGIPPTVEFFRTDERDEPIITISVGDTRGSDPVMAVAHQGIRVASADRVVMMVESWGTNSTVNPEGEEWEPGEMSRRKEELLVRSMIRDVMSISDVRADGGFDFQAVPFVADPIYRKVTWLSETDDPFGGRYSWRPGDDPKRKLHSRVVDAAMDGFAGRAGLPPGWEDFGLTEAEARIHGDAALMRVLLAEGNQAVLWLRHSEPERAEILLHSTQLGGLDVRGIAAEAKRRNLTVQDMETARVAYEIVRDVPGPDITGQVNAVWLD